MLSLSESVPLYAQHAGTKCLQSNMAAGVQQDLGLIEPLQSTVDQTDVGMEKEDRGQMMFTECQVRQSCVSYRVIHRVFLHNQTRKTMFSDISNRRRIYKCSQSKTKEKKTK